MALSLASEEFLQSIWKRGREGEIPLMFEVLEQPLAAIGGHRLGLKSPIPKQGLFQLHQREEAPVRGEGCGGNHVILKGK